MTADGPPARDAVSARLASTAPELGPAFLSAYESAGREPARRRFGGVSQRLHELAAEAASHGPHTATLANRWLLARLAETFDATAAPLPLPPEVLAGYPAHIARILRQAEELPDEAFDVSRDSFQKDLGLLTFRLIPVGVFFGDAEAPVSRRYARRGGVRQLLRYLRVIRLECHGRDPFLSLHLNEAALEGWGEAAFVPSHLAAAAVLELNPRLKGVTGGGSIIDPQLDRVAPHLAWVRKRTVAAGGSVFYLRHDQAGTSGALTRSETRRRLFAEGQYVPQLWLRVWPRRALLRWAAKQRSLPAPSGSPPRSAPGARPG